MWERYRWASSTDLGEWLFNGNHSADWWMVALTVVLAIGAFLALRATNRQLGLLRGQVEQEGTAAREELELLREQIRQEGHAQAAQLLELKKSRESSLRPYLIMSTRETAGGGNPYFEVELENIGPGPALGAAITCWIFDGRVVPDSALPALAEGTYDGGEGDWRWIGAISAGAKGERRSFYVTRDLWDAPSLVLRVDASYRDIFGNLFQAPGEGHPDYRTVGRYPKFW